MRLYQAVALEMAARDGARFVFSNNRSSYGGAVQVDQSLLAINQVDFNENQAVDSYSNGGAIDVRSGSLVVDQGAFTSNATSWYGGAVHSQSGDIWLRNTEFTANTSNQGYGGALASRGVGSRRASAFLENVTFEANKTLSVEGGAIYNNRSSPLSTGSAVRAYIADSIGWALANTIGQIP